MRAHIFVSGRVQGVGFRYFTAGHARRLGVTGFVQNLRDGRVEVVAQGERAEVEALVAALRRGPPGSAVRTVLVNWMDAPPPPSDGEPEFIIR
jgi:acylphosphatase